MARARVWLALFATPVLLGLAFAPFAAWLMRSRGLEGEALAEALQPIAVFPATLGFGAVLVLTRALAKRDGLSLGALGWARPSLADVAIGFGAAAVLGALNAWVFYPLVQAAQPSFDPALPKVSLGAAALTLLVAAVGEDTLYRGYALHVLEQRHGALVGVGVTSVFYALVTPAQGLALVLWAGYFGVVLCGLRLWRKNLWPVTIAHALVALGPKLMASL